MNNKPIITPKIARKKSGPQSLQMKIPMSLLKLTDLDSPG